MNMLETMMYIVSILGGLAGIGAVVYTIIQGGKHEDRIKVMESNHLVTLENRTNNLYTIFGEMKKKNEDFQDLVFEKLEAVGNTCKSNEVMSARLDERLIAVEKKIP